MQDFIISQIAPILATALAAILVAIIKQIGNVVIEYIKSKKNAVEQSIAISRHAQDLQTAKEVWNIVEEKFRITENAKEILDSKANEFDKLLLQKIPGLSQQNLDDLRQAIAGEFNKGKEAIAQTNTIDQSEQITPAQINSDSPQIDNSTSSQIAVDTPEEA